MGKAVCTQRAAAADSGERDGYAEGEVEEEDGTVVFVGSIGFWLLLLCIVGAALLFVCFCIGCVVVQGKNNSSSSTRGGTRHSSNGDGKQLQRIDTYRFNASARRRASEDVNTLTASSRLNRSQRLNHARSSRRQQQV